jgi:hypothetical protein
VLQRWAGSETVLVAWNAGRTRQTYSLKSGLAAQALTGSLYREGDGERQKAGLSVRGGYLHLSLPPRSAAAFVLGQAAGEVGQ